MVRISGKYSVKCRKKFFYKEKSTLGNADGSTSQTEILGTKIVIMDHRSFVVGSQKISRSSKGLYLKSSIINAMASNPAAHHS